MSKEIKPDTIRLETSSICQLRCPSCPNTSGKTLPVVGRGFLKLNNFQKILNDNPWVIRVELANLGEIFLNPDLLEIIKHAYKRGVILTAATGANLNNVKEDVLEGLVKYKFRTLSCSIDGASNKIYKQYRVKGNYDTVIENIKKINFFKKKYQSKYPELRWNFIIFNHNEHEIPIAEELADELNMDFNLRAPWNSDFASLRHKTFIRLIREKAAAASREEHIGILRNLISQRYGVHYLQRICHQMWDRPQINWDGKILGCCCNSSKEFGGNAFTDGLIKSFNSETMTYARDMLLGIQNRRRDIPCSTCPVYLNMEKSKKYIQVENESYNIQ